MQSRPSKFIHNMAVLSDHFYSAQFMLDTFVSAKARRDLIPTYLDAWTVSTLRHFGIKAISCMSQTPQILFHSQMPQNKPPLLVRNSDDFFPEIPTSHPWHIWMNAHNALFTQHLNVIPDWDMFQTVHDYSGFHAAARCVSGGPIYITDVPGQHNLDLIGQMTGPTPRGKTVIFRTSVVGMSLDQYNGYDDENLLLVGTYHGTLQTLSLHKSLLTASRCSRDRYSHNRHLQHLSTPSHRTHSTFKIPRRHRSTVLHRPGALQRTHHKANASRRSRSPDPHVARRPRLRYPLRLPPPRIRRQVSNDLDRESWSVGEDGGSCSCS